MEQAPKDGTLLDLWVVFTGHSGTRFGERKTDCRWRKESATYVEGWHDCYGTALEWRGESRVDGDLTAHPEYGRKVTHFRALPASPVMGEGAGDR